MKSNVVMNFNVDKENKKIKVEREFDAPVTKVWAAWTEKELLDQWWAPKPWKARTKTMDFREGGHWLYAMVGPEGEEHWARVDYKSIAPLRSFTAADAFCDENGNISDSMPGSDWENTFKEESSKTLVFIEITFKELKDLEQTLEMGFKEGFEMGLSNLDELLASQE
ncbi:SRPBCC domain-containing protein [Dyadobacter sp. CY343]|uniref:SRPBCC family protein n=1 Tax=Dyadobacter sp. CY343 TaxID=2907299 RepID=UPI001F22D117|nr:SRPBCC domain-containing protein [Dyadobacter sp. CY343]MCE7060832.1 SRPBCC domain-containing protein [Dyadobacter sp. CY343]